MTGMLTTIMLVAILVMVSILVTSMVGTSVLQTSMYSTHSILWTTPSGGALNECFVMYILYELLFAVLHMRTWCLDHWHTRSLLNSHSSECWCTVSGSLPYLHTYLTHTHTPTHPHPHQHPHTQKVTTLWVRTGRFSKTSYICIYISFLVCLSRHIYNM